MILPMSNKTFQYLSKFANMIRITLNQSKENFTTLWKNMEHLEITWDGKTSLDDSFNFRIIIT